MSGERQETVADILREWRSKFDCVECDKFIEPWLKRIETAHERECKEAEEGKFSVNSYRIVLHNAEALITVLRKSIRKYRSYAKIRHVEKMEARIEKLERAIKPILGVDLDCIHDPEAGWMQPNICFEGVSCDLITAVKSAKEIMKGKPK